MQNIVVMYLNGVNINSLNMQSISSINWDEQEALLQQTLKHPLLIKYPIKQSYCIAFLKKLISHLEENRIEVHDLLYKHLCELLTTKLPEQEYSFKHFCVFDSNKSFEIITLKESSNLISYGTTGLRSWEAALVLSELCWHARKSLSNKCILELGSGAGFAGIFIAKFCQSSKLILSDSHEKVLSLLVENVDLNIGSSITSTNSKFDFNLHETSIEGTSRTISVINFPWEEISTKHEYLSSNVPDYVFGADIVYDPDLFYSLCLAIKSILYINSKCKVILVNTIRNRNNYNEFLKCLELNDLTHQSLPVPEQKKLIWNTSTEYNIISISNYKYSVPSFD